MRSFALARMEYGHVLNQELNGCLQTVVYSVERRLKVTTQQYVFGSYIDEPILKEDANGNIVYYTRNQQYSVTALTDTSGNVIKRYAYTAYGKTTIFDGAGAPIEGMRFFHGK